MFVITNNPFYPSPEVIGENVYLRNGSQEDIPNFELRPSSSHKLATKYLPHFSIYALKYKEYKV